MTVFCCPSAAYPKKQIRCYPFSFVSARIRETNEDMELVRQLSPPNPRATLPRSFTLYQPRLFGSAAADGILNWPRIMRSRPLIILARQASSLN